MEELSQKIKIPSRTVTNKFIKRKSRVTHTSKLQREWANSVKKHSLNAIMDAVLAVCTYASKKEILSHVRKPFIIEAKYFFSLFAQRQGYDVLEVRSYLDMDRSTVSHGVVTIKNDINLYPTCNKLYKDICDKLEIGYDWNENVPNFRIKYIEYNPGKIFFKDEL